MIPALRLPPVALNSEPEVETTLSLLGGVAITIPEHSTAAGTDAHQGAREVPSGLVEAQFHQGPVIRITFNDGAAAAQAFCFCPIFGSVPAINRSMLLRCRHSTIRLATSDTTT